MKAIIIILLLSANTLHAGTPGNKDESTLFYIVLGILAVMLSIDYLLKYLKDRKAAKHEEESLHELE